jgi:hypothetical protein
VSPFALHHLLYTRLIIIFRFKAEPILSAKKSIIVTEHDHKPGGEHSEVDTAENMKDNNTQWTIPERSNSFINSPGGRYIVESVETGSAKTGVQKGGAIEMETISSISAQSHTRSDTDVHDNNNNNKLKAIHSFDDLHPIPWYIQIRYPQFLTMTAFASIHLLRATSYMGNMENFLSYLGESASLC